MEVSVNRRNPMLGVVRSKPAERPVLAQTLKTPSYEELQREVADLRAEVQELRSEESPIRLDPQNDCLTVKTTSTLHSD